ncbi:hypothetical protein GO755_00320 [Spirosoma sp. HMF4905]|uniref:Histidine kinase n=1 Tax=Spirosoma arboris TaxID=2682092 RepID=A0A7K1S412_9BACT|nr:histidine kinase [Spirosoma arboris]MVM28455.1 hypothetical protein [Spirosoma arboris]
MNVLRRYRIVSGLFWLIGILSGIGSPCYAQVNARIQNVVPLQKTPPPFCRTFTQADGLPTGRISTLCQTRDGFLWLIIEHLGLVRFDGQHFRLFGADVLPGTDIHEMVEGRDSALYLASNKGLCRFDLRTYQARLFPQPGALEIVHETQTGQLLVGGHQGIYAFDKTSFHFRDLRHDPVVDAVTGQSRPDSIPPIWLDVKTSPDPSGLFWLFFGGHKGSIYAYHPHKHHWLAYSTPTNRSRSLLLQNQWFSNLYPDENGRYIWISGWQTGLQRLDRQTGEWVCYDFGDRTLNNCLEIAPGTGQDLWLTFDGVGLARFNRQTGQLAFSPPRPALLGGLSPGLMHIRNGKSGARWLFGAGSQLTGILPSQQRMLYLKTLPAQERIVTLWHDDVANRTLYASFDDHFVSSLYLRERDGTIRHRRFPDLNAGGNESLFRFLKMDGKGMLWTGVTSQNPQKNGLYRIDYQTLRIERVTRRVGGKLTTDSLDFTTARTDDAGNLWIATARRGVVCLPPGTGPGRLWPIWDKSARNSWVITLLPDHDRRIWLARQFSLQRLTPSTGQIEEFFPNSLEIRTLCLDAEGSVWASNHAGVWRLRKQEKTFRRMIPRLAAYQGVADTDGAIWLTANDAMYRFKPKTGSLERLDGQNGLSLEPIETEYIDKRLLLTKTGDLLISDQYRFATSGFRTDSSTNAPLVFTSFNVFNQAISLARTIDSQPEVRLNYQQNFFTIEYATLDFLPTTQHRYQYRLEGLEDNWQQNGDRRTVSYTNIEPGTYHFHVRAANADGHWGPERVLTVEIQPPFWMTAWFRLLTISLLIGLVYGFHRYRLAQLKYRLDMRRREAELREREALLLQRLSETELTALRAQMNPHFIFNCLNSIKLYTSENDSEKASEYLTKFSRLIRLVLENSRSERVKLQNELDMLQLYADMEIMRFKQKLSFSVDVDASIDTRFVEIPPLLIQPYVENAIWHGLMHKPEGGCVRVRVTHPQDDLLQLTISDDGIGRARATELKSKSASHRKSFGLKMTSERIALVNQLYHTNTKVLIEDLMDAEGQPAGTEVTIQIPI